MKKQRKPLICNIMLGRRRGGLEQCFIDYCRALKNTHEFLVCAIVDERCEYIDQLEKYEIPYRALKVRGIWDLLSRFQMRKTLLGIRPDATICHGNRALSLVPSSIENIIYVTHNDSWKRIHKADHFFAITTTMQDRLMRLGVEKHNVWLMPNMLDFTRKSLDKNWHQPVRIGTLGRFVPKKGFEIFLMALTELRFRGIPFQAILGGHGPLFSELAQMLKTQDLQEHVKMPGWIVDKEKFFDDIDIFCLPSHEEPFGLVMLEAMARKKAIVATLTDGPRDVLKNRETALLTPIGDHQKLFQSLEELTQNPTLARRLASHAYSLFRSQYTLEAGSKRLGKTLRKILDASHTISKKSERQPWRQRLLFTRRKSPPR